MKLVCAGCCIAVAALAQETFSGSAALDAAVDESVRAGLIPGAVVVVGHDGKIVHRKAYGSRALLPGDRAVAGQPQPPADFCNN